MPNAIVLATRTKIAKAQEFLEIAMLTSNDAFDASVSLAVSAAVNASDALLLMNTGNYPSGRDHSTAAGALRKAGLNRASTYLARVLALKNKAQYSVARCTNKDVDTAVTNAERLLEQAVAKANTIGSIDD